MAGYGAFSACAAAGCPRQAKLNKKDQSDEFETILPHGIPQ
ncbi:hypothetical protein [Alloacidobacterium dinghuense]|nr:hypothetical protein [Alloacidobacterium dinghuense]